MACTDTYQPNVRPGVPVVSILFNYRYRGIEGLQVSKCTGFVIGDKRRTFNATNV